MVVRSAAFTPKLITALREGYSFGAFRADAVAGFTVAVVALPLAMALGIASGASPDKGLITAVVAGFLISTFGGSRLQVGGPTGAFVVVIFNVIAQHGYGGLLIATFLAGAILVLAGVLRLGELIRFIPHTVIIGFTAGIAIIIASSQVKDFLGLSLETVPAEFLPQWQAYARALASTEMVTVAVGTGALALIFLLRRLLPRAPGFLIAVIVSSAAVAWFHLPVETIGSRFGSNPIGWPVPSLPDISLLKITAVLPAAFTIAFLAGVEALLSAVVADGMAGTRHRPNQELIGQGIANLGSALFGGLPATGAIARTATNIRSGARTPVAGLLHAVFLLLFIAFAGDLMTRVPMAALAAVLFVVALGMSEYERFLSLLRMPNSDRAVLLTTFGLTVFVDLTAAIAVGITLASLLFMAGMAAATGIDTSGSADPDLDSEDREQRGRLPAGVEVFRLTGPLFFGVAGQLLETLRRIGPSPRVIILRMRLVPLLDASGARALKEFVDLSASVGTSIVISGAQPQPRAMLDKCDLNEEDGQLRYASDYASALTVAAALSSR